MDKGEILKLEAHERARKWRPEKFSLTHRGRMSWADWFTLRALAKEDS